MSAIAAPSGYVPPVVCPGCGALWRVVDHLDAVGADGRLHMPLGPLEQATLASVFTAAGRVRAATAEEMAERSRAFHASVYQLIHRVQAQTLGEVAGLLVMQRGESSEECPEHGSSEAVEPSMVGGAR